MSGVFLSYRRDDTAAIVGRLYDRLAGHFGKEQVFRDVDAIAPGDEFAKVIKARIAQSNVLVVVIGKAWLDGKTDAGKRRLDEPNDCVKAEICEALNQKKRVIPALVEGASFPKAEQLPAEIAALVDRNYLEVSDSRFDFDAERLIKAVEDTGVTATQANQAASSKSSGRRAGTSDPRNQGTLTFIGSGVAAVVVALWSGYVYFKDPSSAPQVPASPSVVVNGNVAPAGGGIANLGGTVNVTQHFAGGDPARLEQLARELGVKDTALENFFRILGEAKIDAKDLDTKLHEIAAKHKQLLSRVAEPDGGDAALRELKAQAHKAIDVGKYDEAAKLLNQASDKDAAIGKERLRSAAASKAQNAELKTLEFKYEEAARYYQQAHDLLPVGEAVLRARYLNWAGESLYYAGNYAEAKPVFENVLAIREKALDAEHTDVAESLNNLAVLYYSQGGYGQAEPLYQRALTIRESALGVEHPGLATTLNNLAELNRAQGRYARAEPLHQRALRIRERALGLDHPDVGTSLSNLALLYNAQGRYTEAEPLHHRALMIREKALGAEHPDVAMSVNNLAALYHSQGRYAQAEPLYQRALKIWEEALGPEHPNVATALERYAEVLAKTDRAAEAAKLKARAQAIREKHDAANASAAARK